MMASSLLASTSRMPEGRLVFTTVHSRALEGNLLGDSPDRSMIVYLPPSYERSPARRYPVLYLLHGNGGTGMDWIDGSYQGLNIKTTMDSLIAAGGSKEMIVVMPDASNAFGGSHYVNSTATGRWADFIARDLVEYVDKTYRTLASSASRGLAGHSMGGRGTLFLAATTPGVYGAIYALSAGKMAFEKYPPFTDSVWRRVLSLWDPGGTGFRHLRDSNLDWVPDDVVVPLSFAAAYSPNPAKPPFYADLPVDLHDGAVTVVDSVFQRWVAEDPITVVRAHPENLRRLRAVYLSCGTSDGLIGANRLMAQVLDDIRVPYTFEEYEGDHDGQIRERMTTKVLPMFSRILVFQ